MAGNRRLKALPTGGGLMTHEWRYTPAVATDIRVTHARFGGAPVQRSLFDVMLPVAQRRVSRWEVV